MAKRIFPGGGEGNTHVKMAKRKCLALSRWKFTWENERERASENSLMREFPIALSR